MSESRKEESFKSDALAGRESNDKLHLHDYIPISWSKTKSSQHVTMLMCRICFHRLNLEDVFAHFPVEAAPLPASLCPAEETPDIS